LRAEIAEREQAEAALRQVQKMEAIGQLTGGVAHDFNNLLAAVLGNLQLVLGQVTNENIRRLVSNAEDAAWRGAKLTEQLLAFSRKQRLDAQAVDLNALVSKMNDLLVHTIGSTVRIEIALGPDVWPAFVDASQIELVILNLAINSRDAMPSGGRITVGTANVRSSDPERPAELAPGDYIAVSVADTGVGMTDDVRAKAFEPFFTTKDLGQGTGLGLSQVYGVARQSSGTVRLETELGRGTKVTVYLPRARAQPAAQHPSEARTTSSESRQCCVILVVDDDPDVRTATVDVVQALGHKAIAAENGRAALDILDREAPVDLMLIDYAMPELNGAETARLVRAKRPHMRILMMTGYAHLAGPDEFAEAGDILKKPFGLADLGAKIEDALRGRGTGMQRWHLKVVPVRSSQPH
jgi:nitrogen-specific signal transduction histidine kinase/ActR/RegA family two-component response regulator